MERICRRSGDRFTIRDDERCILERHALPLPSLCPDERARNRLAWRNERTLYRRPCDVTGKSIVSIFDRTVPFPVFEQAHWWFDHWDALDCGRPFDFSRPFFAQCVELLHDVPQCALRCPQSENSEYTNRCEKNTDCYLIFCSNGSRECLRGMWYQTCVERVDPNVRHTKRMSRRNARRLSLRLCSACRRDLHRPSPPTRRRRFSVKTVINVPWIER